MVSTAANKVHLAHKTNKNTISVWKVYITSTHKVEISLTNCKWMYLINKVKFDCEEKTTI